MDNSKFLLGEVRKLTKKSRDGARESYNAFKELVSLLLHQTVLKQNEVIRFSESPVPGRFLIGGSKESVTPLELNDGHYLRLSIVFRADAQMRRLTVLETSYQYQPNRDKDHHWMFRYDYLKYPLPQDPHSSSHLQINAKLPQSPLGHHDLHKIHFPVGRMSLEAVIRLLAEEFHVPCNTPTKIWWPILAESERLFHEVAHTPLSGPSK